MKKLLPSIIYLTSIVFFVLGLTHPIMATDTLFGLKRESIFLVSSIEYFFDKGDWFVGSILLFFTLIFPILKYLFLGTQLLNFRFPNKGPLITALELINKWAMLDVFVVALIIINMKFDSVLIVTTLKAGTTYFALSVLLLMVCSFIISKSINPSPTLAVKMATDS
ncbi:MAG: paraquat-inducible protein A [Bacteroidota bacterium]